MIIREVAPVCSICTSIRFWGRALQILLVGIAAIAVVLAAGGMGSALPEVIQARRMEVLNEAGRVVVSLGGYAGPSPVPTPAPAR